MNRLDFSMPLQDSDGKPVTLLAVDPTDALAKRLRGCRYEGQNVALERHEGTVSWCYYDGGYVNKGDGKFRNVPPEPVVVKVQRKVRFYERATNPLSTAPLDAGGRTIIGTVEFTVADGVLTNVEIVK